MSHVCLYTSKDGCPTFNTRHVVWIMSKIKPHLSKVCWIHSRLYCSVYLYSVPYLGYYRTQNTYYYYFFLFGVLCRFQYYTGHSSMGSWKGRGNQYIQFVRVLYCTLPTNGKQLPAFPLEAVLGTEPWPQRWEGRVLPLCHRDPSTHHLTHMTEQVQPKHQRLTFP